jgi:hypothetical protein
MAKGKKSGTKTKYVSKGQRPSVMRSTLKCGRRAVYLRPPRWKTFFARMTKAKTRGSRFRIRISLRPIGSLFAFARMIFSAVPTIVTTCIRWYPINEVGRDLYTRQL